MGKKYRQISLEERCKIAQLYGAGQSIRKIATAMGRQPSTIAREISRNMTKTKGYMPAYADNLAQARCWHGSKLEREPALREAVLDRLAMGWSPQQVAGRLAQMHGKTIISYESIYRFIHAQLVRTNDWSWRHYLPQAKAKRGYRKRKSKVHSYLPNRTSIHERPAIAPNEAGHWEADLFSFAKGTKTVIVLADKASRLIMATVKPNKKSLPVCNFLKAMLETLPQTLRKTLTLDNGTEFAKHQSLPVQTFFCDPYSPWQKGMVENTIGRLRRFLPRKTNINQLSIAKLNDIIMLYNHTPRKCLDFKTPAEAFLKQLLHFKCESTPVIKTG